jgi:two-component system response regulator AtoC
VRELRNVMEQAVLMAAGPVLESVDLDWLPAAGKGPPAIPSPVAALNLEQVERETLLKALESCRWNVSQAARILGITRDALRYRIEKHGLSVPG